MEVFTDLISSSEPVVVMYYAEWCKTCNALFPVLEQVKASHGNSIRVVKVDVEKNRELTLNYSVLSVPTVLIFKEGKQLWRQSGGIDADELSKIVEMFK